MQLSQMDSRSGITHLFNSYAEKSLLFTQKQVGQVPNEEQGDNDITEDEIGDPGCTMPAFH